VKSVNKEIYPMDLQCAFTVTPKPNAPNLFEVPTLSAVALPTARADGVKPQLLCENEQGGCIEKMLHIKRNVLEPAFRRGG
jgi:hypothetical protein